MYKNEINLEENCHPTCKTYVTNLPQNMQEYTMIIICRNPYKRLLSGFLDKYKKCGQFKHKWKNEIITFNIFIEELLKENWEKIDFHHFSLQTSEYFDETKIMNSDKIFVYDIANINYSFIEDIYGKKIPELLLNEKCVHVREKYDETLDGPVYDLQMNKYFEKNVTIQQFYNEDIKQKIYLFYKDDFDFFKKFGINYDDITQ